MTIQQMMQAHPHPLLAGEVVAQCVEECFHCAATCSSCADACLGEDDTSELVRCIRLNLDCADVCETTGRVVSRQTAVDVSLVRDVVVACATACRACAEECDRHAGHHDHCRACADACRRCEQTCQDLLSTLP